MEEKQTRSVWHYLHNSASGRVDAVINKNSVIFKLPNLNTLSCAIPCDAEYRLPIDLREKRTLVVFDGRILCDGLPKNGSVVLQISLLDLRTPEVYVRKPRLEEEGPLWYVYDDGRNEAMLRICRYFLLLPRSNACVVRYDNKSLRSIYTFIEINKKGVLTWRNSSY